MREATVVFASARSFERIVMCEKALCNWYVLGFISDFWLSCATAASVIVRLGAYAFFIAILKHESFPSLSSRESGPASRRFLISAGASAAEALPVRTPVPHARLAEEAKAERPHPRGAENGVDRSKGLNRIPK